MESEDLEVPGVAALTQLMFDGMPAAADDLFGAAVSVISHAREAIAAELQLRRAERDGINARIRLLVWQEKRLSRLARIANEAETPED